MALDPVHDILPNLPVFSEDGHQLGLVREVTPDRIKIDAPLHTDYWVSRQHVLSFTQERVTLDVPETQLETVKLQPSARG